METITISINKEISKQRIGDLLCTAYEGGINYWCRIDGYLPSDDLEFQWDKNNVYKAIDHPLNNGMVELYDTQEEKTHGLNLVMIQSGLEIMSQKYKRHFNDFINENEDAETADVFVQCCLFGEVVYG